MMTSPFRDLRVVRATLMLGLSALALSGPALAQERGGGSRMPQPSASIVSVAPPRIAEYWMSASRQPDGVIVFDGYVPDGAMRERLGETAGADVNFLKLGSGEPPAFADGVAFGMAALEKLGEGRFALRQDRLSLSGIAASSVDYRSLLAIVAQGAPGDFVLDATGIQPPPVANFTWTARKTASGSLALSGNVPDPTVEAQLLTTAGPGATKAMTYASGGPLDFERQATAGLDLLSLLNAGTISFDGRGWLVSGTPASADADARLRQRFADRGMAASGWAVALSEPPLTSVAQATPEQAPVQAPTSAPAPAVQAEDYSFSASRSNDGQVILSGQAPDDAVLGDLIKRSNGDAAAVTLVAGAPDDFAAQAARGLDALAQLPSGSVMLASGKWSIRGTAAGAQQRDAVTTFLSSNPNWTIDLAVAKPAPTAPVSSAAPPAQRVDVSTCANAVAAISARNAILFQSGSATMTADSASVLDQLATSLSLCPDAVIHVEGHTDSDGEEQPNLALSVARAEAVVAALVTRGIDAARLYAMGYGESKPIADNGTAEGKRLNRRIVISVLPEHS